MSDWQIIVDHISAASGEAFCPNQSNGLSGGSINNAMRLSDGKRHWFVKTNHSSRLDMFEAEAAGLSALAEPEEIRVAQPLCTGIAGSQSYIVMEFINLSGGKGGSQALAGQQLAALHKTNSKQFGWHRDNTIGATPQVNTQSDDWEYFWRHYRLGYQLKLAKSNGYGGKLLDGGERLLDGFGLLLDHSPVPSLIHGDLWGGNLGFDEKGSPVIYDPATYYADREAELAMTELFGGFSVDFYSAYNDVWPLDSGYKIRIKLYKLYHILNHLNLFGT